MTEKMRIYQKGNLYKQNSSKSRTESLKQKISTARLGKTGRVNSFLADPVAYTCEQHQLTIQADSQPYVEPWLEEYEANEPTLKQERSIRNKINAMLTITSDISEKREPSLDIEKVDKNLINKQMKKYQPKNSSFSLFYGEKKGFQKPETDELSSRASSRNTNLRNFKLPVLPIKRSPQEIKAIQQSKRINKASSSFNTLSQQSNNKHVEIILQLKAIERTGEALTDFSSRLIGRIDRASILADQKFGKLSQITSQMTADVGTYQLDEEIDGSYKKELFTTPSKYLKK